MSSAGIDIGHYSIPRRALLHPLIETVNPGIQLVQPTSGILHLPGRRLRLCQGSVRRSFDCLQTCVGSL